MKEKRQPWIVVWFALWKMPRESAEMLAIGVLFAMPMLVLVALANLNTILNLIARVKS